MVQLLGSRVVLREKRLEDAYLDYQWRCDPEVAELDAALPLSMSFERFLTLFKGQVQFPTPGSDHFAIETMEGKYIGNCMYYDLDPMKRQAELGIVIGDRDYWGHGYGYECVKLLLAHMFNVIHLDTVYLHTLEWNSRAQKCFGKCGFAPIRTVRRTGQMFLRMEITRERWCQLESQQKAPPATGHDGLKPSIS